MPTTYRYALRCTLVYSVMNNKKRHDIALPANDYSTVFLSNRMPNLLQMTWFGKDIIAIQ